METLRDALQLTLRDARRAALEPLPSAGPYRRRPPSADVATDDVANELAAVDVRRTPTTATRAVSPRVEPAGPATYGALDEIVDDEVEEPLLDDELLEDPDDLSEEELRNADRSQHEEGTDPRRERPRVRPRRGYDV
jgi:hypothetical protein